MTTTIKLTAAQAMMRWLSVQMTEDGERLIEGVWAISSTQSTRGSPNSLGRRLKSFRRRERFIERVRLPRATRRASTSGAGSKRCGSR